MNVGYRELSLWQRELEASIFFEGDIDNFNPKHQAYLNRKSYYARKVKQIKNLINNLNK